MEVPTATKAEVRRLRTALPPAPVLGQLNTAVEDTRGAAPTHPDGIVA